MVSSPMPQAILVTGATRIHRLQLVLRLLKQGHRVRVLVRSRQRVLSHPWSADVEIAVGDAPKPETLSKALQGVDCAYYPIHAWIFSGLIKAIARRAEEQ